MFGPPKDVEGECNSRLEVGDDYGDNATTFRCSLPPGHEGKHKELFRVPKEGVTLQEAHNIEVTWDGDDRVDDLPPDEDNGDGQG